MIAFIGFDYGLAALRVCLVRPAIASSRYAAYRQRAGEAGRVLEDM
jgi:hypothetical protein